MAVVGIVIAGIALVVGVVSVSVAVREHRIFMRRLNTRADFRLTAKVEDGVTDNLIEVADAGAGLSPRVLIGLENVDPKTTGYKRVEQKAAGPTTLQVCVPQSIYNVGFRWTTQQGAERDSGLRDLPTSTERFGGDVVEVVYLTEELRHAYSVCPVGEFLHDTVRARRGPGDSPDQGPVRRSARGRSGAGPGLHGPCPTTARFSLRS